ncbi:MAG: rod-binding protein [Aureliella sp.]
MQVSSAGGGYFPGSASAERAPASLTGDHLESLGQGVAKKAENGEPTELQDAFQDFVGQTFFAEMIKSMRSTQKGAAYFNGGRAEEIFQGQFDQLMTEHLSDASAKSISDPMFALFQMGRVQ